MKIEITTTPEFDKQYKRLKRKYQSLKYDLLQLEKELEVNPEPGVSLGGNIRKIRISIKSKGKGKSGGARVITYTLLATILNRKILLVTIYDKSEDDSISDDEIKRILRDNGF
jgi:mRNA-degrading endonuclease RelE of RelBE toxin-antitoxin system